MKCIDTNVLKYLINDMCITNKVVYFNRIILFKNYFLVKLNNINLLYGFYLYNRYISVFNHY